LAQSFEEFVEDYRQQGSRHPIADAEALIYEMETGRVADKQDQRFLLWKNNAKKKRSAGKRALIEARKVAEARNRWLKGPK
jgi:hypothetical protein